ncbi:hypothetical protein ACXR2W_11885 [Leucobacter sp. HY1908]
MDSSGVAPYSLPRTALSVTATDDASPLARAVRSVCSALTLGRSGRRSRALRIDIGYEPFFIDFAERTGLALIGGDAPRVDPDHMPAVCPPIGARAVSMLGVAGLLHDTPTGLELWQTHTPRAVSPTGLRTDLVFRIHAPASLQPLVRTVSCPAADSAPLYATPGADPSRTTRTLTVETIGQDLYVSTLAPANITAAELNAFLDVCESASREVLGAATP